MRDNGSPEPCQVCLKTNLPNADLTFVLYKGILGQKAKGQVGEPCNMLHVIEPLPATRPDERNRGYSLEQVQAMQRAVINLFGHWNVNDVDAAIILGGIAPRTFRRWREGDLGRVNRDLADRMSLLLGIHKALRIIFADAQAGYRWMVAPNEAFAGRSALDVLRQGGMEDLVRLRRYLDAVRGGW